jgi:hypothetical protein
MAAFLLLTVGTCMAVGLWSAIAGYQMSEQFLPSEVELRRQVALQVHIVTATPTLWS